MNIKCLALLLVAIMILLIFQNRYISLRWNVSCLCEILTLYSACDPFSALNVQLFEANMHSFIQQVFF